MSTIITTETTSTYSDHNIPTLHLWSSTKSAKATHSTSLKSLETFMLSFKNAFKIRGIFHVLLILFGQCLMCSGSFPNTFDEINTPAYIGRNIGWVKVVSCTEGNQNTGTTFTYPTGDKGVSIIDYAITMKIVPSNINPLHPSFDNFAVYAQMCMNNVMAMNNLQTMSFVLNSTLLTFNGFTTQSVINTNWYGTTTATNRLINSCRNSLDPDPWTATVYHACNNYAGIHIFMDTQCYWEWLVNFGIDIDIYLGFDANKTEICDGTGTGRLIGAFHHTAAPTKSPTTANPTINPSMSPNSDYQLPSVTVSTLVSSTKKSILTSTEKSVQESNEKDTSDVGLYLGMPLWMEAVIGFGIVTCLLIVLMLCIRKSKKK
eukprot:50617_1